MTVLGWKECIFHSSLPVLALSPQPRERYGDQEYQVPPTFLFLRLVKFGYVANKLKAGKKWVSYTSCLNFDSNRCLFLT